MYFCKYERECRLLSVFDRKIELNRVKLFNLLTVVYHRDVEKGRYTAVYGPGGNLMSPGTPEISGRPIGTQLEYIKHKYLNYV